jgi:ADP-ribosylglycohydrolase
MIGAIAGDIIGSRFEGQPGPSTDFALFHPDCRFTDDTVCSLAVADALMGAKDFAARLRAFVRRHPDRGYGGMFIDWAFADAMGPYGSWGNGAPMRVAAVGWLAKDDAEAAGLAASQAAVSHNHPEAMSAAQAVAVAIFLLRKREPVTAVRERLTRDFGYDLTAAGAFVRGGYDVSAAGTVPPAVAAAFEATDWETAVRTAVCLGGDTDTLACITGAVAEAINGVPAEISTATRNYLTEDLRAVLNRFEAFVGSL